MPTDSIQDEQLKLMRASLSTQEKQLKLMRKSLIIQLGMLDVPQQTIRSIVECDLVLVGEVLKLLDMKKIKAKKGGS